MSTAEPPEIIPPGEPLPEERDLGALDLVKRLVTLLDDQWTIPGTKVRFGLDPLIGLLPGVGDVLGAILGFLVIFAGWRRGLAGITLTRMLTNVAIDALVGTVPVAGDLFDFAWKSNRRNYDLILRAQQHGPRHHTGRDWAFLALIAAALAALAALPVALLALLLWALRALLR